MEVYAYFTYQRATDIIHTIFPMGIQGAFNVPLDFLGRKYKNKEDM
jgi:hypothetical protein